MTSTTGTKGFIMGTIAPNELIKQWEIEEITVEMAIGHILQNLVSLQKTINATNLSQRRLRTDTDHLITHTGINSNKGRFGKE